MDKETLLELLAYTLPAIVTGVVAYYLIHDFLKHDEKLKRLQFHRSNQKDSLPMRLQAYERLVLFLERINPNKLLVRIYPTGDDKELYLNTLTNAVEQEYEHNLSQQIYVSQSCWKTVVTAKNAILQLLRTEATSNTHKNASEFQEAVIMKSINEQTISEQALTILKNEALELF